MEPTFNPGDVVRLKSGGDLMTVRTAGDVVVCDWFDAGNQLHHGDFAAELLCKPDPATVEREKAARRSLAEVGH